MGTLKRAARYLQWAAKNFLRGFRDGLKLCAYAGAAIFLTSFSITSCMTANADRAYKDTLSKAATMRVATRPQTRCVDRFTFLDFPEKAMGLTTHIIELACHEMAIMTGTSYEDIAATMQETLVVVQMHNSDEVCEISNIHTCTIDLPDTGFFVIMVDERGPDTFSAIRHEALHVLMHMSGIRGQQVHHLIMRKFGICGQLYVNNGSHFCGDITDESVKVLPN